MIFFVAFLPGKLRQTILHLHGDFSTLESEYYVKVASVALGGRLKMWYIAVNTTTTTTLE